MHPPFIFTDHKVGPDPYQVRDAKPPRRNRPRRLELRADLPGWPAVPFAAPPVAWPLLADGQPVRMVTTLQVVPPPRNSLRDNFGRWLIRLGQRMIMERHPG